MEMVAQIVTWNNLENIWQYIYLWSYIDMTQKGIYARLLKVVDLPCYKIGREKVQFPFVADFK